MVTITEKVVHGEKRFVITRTVHGQTPVTYDVRSEEAALERVADLLKSGNVPMAEIAPARKPEPKPTAAMIRQYGSWAGQL